jgi:uncharacterized RDD family membrane protein YckC
MTTTAPGRPGAADVPGDWTAGDLVVTGEAVALELRPATAVHRILSGVIDLAIYAMVGFAVLLAISRLIRHEGDLGIVVVLVSVLAMVVLPVTVETLTRGLSAGKLAAGIRVVRDDGGPIRFRHALVRAMLGVVEIWTTSGSLAVITSIVHRRSKRLGDILAGTYAVRVRGAEDAVAPLLMPPELTRWAATADIRRLPDQLALHARVFLSRTGKLDPRLRDVVGRQFAAAVEPYVAPPPPWGTHPERFVAAVLVARRDREYRAGLSSEQRDAAVAGRTRHLPFGIPEVG